MLSFVRGSLVHSSSRGLRGLLIAGSVAGVLALGPSALHAQVPVQDDDIWPDELENTALQLGKWYAVAQELRDAALSRLEETFSFVREARRMRRKYERMAVGELGKLGGEVIPTDLCAIDEAGEEVCMVAEDAGAVFRDFEKAINTEIAALQSDAFDELSVARSDVREFLGEKYKEGAEAARNELLASGRSEYAVDEPYIQTRLTNAEELKRLTLRVDSLAAYYINTETKTKEGKPKEISSGRAKQIRAQVAYVETKAQLIKLKTDIAGLEGDARKLQAKMYRKRARASMISKLP